MGTDRIDMEDITTRVDELREERDDLQTAIDDAAEALAEAITKRGELNGDDDGRDYQEAVTDAEDAETAHADALAALADWDGAEELAELEALLEELRGAGGGDHKYNGDWYPRELIADYSFEEYAQELAEECYSIPDTWPHRCIDWEEAARELAQDYSMVTFRGTDYYWR